VKKYILSLVFCSDILLLMAQPGSWQQKSDLGWNTPNGPTNRIFATGFTIGNKAYIGTGFDGKCRNDFWQYDPLADAWTQKANFGGTARENATGFTIGSNGYIGTGDTGNNGVAANLRDFWEYDTAANTWTQKANFPGGARTAATGFSIGGKGYLGTGFDSVLSYTSDFWEYDPLADAWTPKADFGGSARFHAVGFCIGNKGFIGTGEDGNIPFLAYKNDFWEYDPLADSWTQKAGFGGGVRSRATGFSIGDKGFIGAGVYFNGTNFNDFWVYDTAADNWTQIASFGGNPRNSATGFSVGGSGFIVSGGDGSIATGGGGAYYNDLWEYDTLSASWARKAGFGGGGRVFAIGFGISGKGYLGMGANGDNSPSGNLTDFWEYDTLANSWSQKASFAGSSRADAIGFSIGSKGYAGLGDTAGSYLNDFWEFDPVLNTWTQKANFGGGGREYPTGISIGAKGYIGLGLLNGAFLNDFWTFDPVANTWTQMGNFAGNARYEAVGFGVGNKGYIGLGYGAGLSDSTFWEYDPATDRWTQKRNYPGSWRLLCTAFSIANNGYIGLGSVSNNELWEYDTAADSWTRQTGFAGGGRAGAVGFSIGNNGYIGTGESAFSVSTGGILASDFWQYSPQGAIRTAIGDYSVPSACPSLSGSGFAWEADSSNSLVFGINANNNNLGATCWGIRNVAANAYRNSFGRFGGSQAMFGTYLTRNYLITPASEPDSVVTMRLYCTNGELTNFINYFNTTYGTAYTQSSIQIVRYDGINQDLDPTNNSNLAADYTAITPTSIGSYSDADLYFEFGTARLSEFYIALSSLTAPLAINLLNFSALYNSGVSLLHWQTAQEENSSRFDILRSTDNKQYDAIGSVPAAGNSTSIRSYSFADLTAGALSVKTIYYRLVETDLDSQKVYSKIAAVNIAGTNNGISVIPNPATDIITVQLNTTTANDMASLIISDMTGRKMEARNITLSTGDNIVPLSIQNLSAGVYIIVVTSNETKWWAKFVKK
jgi:hypothetical protein